MKIIFATLARSRPHVKTLQSVQAYDRLVSYHEIKDTEPGWLEHFVMTGTTTPSTAKPQKRKKTIKKRRSLALFRRVEMYDKTPPEAD